MQLERVRRQRMGRHCVRREWQRQRHGDDNCRVESVGRTHGASGNRRTGIHHRPNGSTGSGTTPDANSKSNADARADANSRACPDANTGAHSGSDTDSCSDAGAYADANSGADAHANTSAADDDAGQRNSFWSVWKMPERDLFDQRHDRCRKRLD